eukprot:TRINITY_DN1229_c0_g1_i1.p1 TRINITY_DN1229_c0_g1~~TRINITY_DN1229_c0_g1_i1.p1  ORF type:complete len:338 (+),score=82.62 TRINITY_DN1229_c0_g1_i1:66-1016(+)
MDACAEAKAAGNAAYAEGDLDSALERYSAAMQHWERALSPSPATYEVGARVRYGKQCFGMVMSSFTMFDEYFLKDLGREEAVWAGEIGGELKRFPAKDLRPVSDALWDLRFAIAQNLAAVCLKLSRYDEAIRWADAALSMDGKAPKALMRLGAALLHSGQPGPASDRLAAAAKAMPKDKEVAKLLREAEKKRSPTWVCASGCCGPWGIVCGGSVVDAMPEVVKPRQKAEVQATKAADDDSGSICSSTTASTEPATIVKEAEPAKLSTEAAPATEDMGRHDKQTSTSSCPQIAAAIAAVALAAAAAWQFNSGQAALA